MLLVLVIPLYVYFINKHFLEYNFIIQVPKDRARIRVQVSAAHSKADLQQCINAFVEVGRELKVIK